MRNRARLDHPTRILVGQRRESSVSFSVRPLSLASGSGAKLSGRQSDRDDLCFLSAQVTSARQITWIGEQATVSRLKDRSYPMQVSRGVRRYAPRHVPAVGGRSARSLRGVGRDW